MFAVDSALPHAASASMATSEIAIFRMRVTLRDYLYLTRLLHVVALRSEFHLSADGAVAAVLLGHYTM